MVALLSIYEEEDEAYQDLVTVATTFFQYLLQPFRDMRELACLYKMEILVITNMHFGSYLFDILILNLYSSEIVMFNKVSKEHPTVSYATFSL